METTEPHKPPMQLRLAVMPPVDCPYLPGRRETVRGLMASSIDPEVYQSFMDAGFRRSGHFVYQPVCEDCRACVQLRVPVAGFVASKSQRRCGRQNADLVGRVGVPVMDEEKAALYARYVADWHGRPGDGAAETLREFLYESPTDTLEFTYRDPGGRLLAVGICDVGEHYLSSVYFYFDPAERKRGLGTMGALREIDWCRSNGRSHYYLGYWVKDCSAMAYKANYRPHELLQSNGDWMTVL